MARLRPFRALHPAPGREDEVASPPYDVVSEEEVRRWCRDNRSSFFHVTRPEVHFPPGTSPYDPEVYRKAGEALDEMQDRGILVRDETPSYYIYQMEEDGRKQTGLVASVHSGDYENNTIKKHELTREDKEDDRVRHLEATNANTGPVYLLYSNREKENLEEFIPGSAPVAEVTREGVTHRIFRLSDSGKVEEFTKRFSSRELYIADGHHRAASAVRVARMRREKQDERAPDYFLSVIFPHNELKILPYNRLVHDLAGMGVEEYISKVEMGFRVEKGSDPVPSGRGEFCMYLDGTWYRLIPLERAGSDPVASLDVSILQDRLLSPVLGIRDPRRDNRISFVGGIKGTGELERQVDSGNAAVAFSLFPTGIEQLVEVSDAGGLMPPKSTWFEPKLLSGLVIHPLADD